MSVNHFYRIREALKPVQVHISGGLTTRVSPDIPAALRAVDEAEKAYQSAIVAALAIEHARRKLAQKYDDLREQIENL